MGCGLRKSGWSTGPTVDLTVAHAQSSPELGLAAALGHGDLPRRRQRQKGGAGTLVVGSPWAERW
jgi:hypothetical protein